MQNYDFLILSPYEFENFSRDLLQKHFATFIESFTTGRDNGIDLRYTKTKSKAVVIQAKRYKDYSALYANLKKEASKVRNLNPAEYVLTTSVGLTPHNKAEILSLFDPFIKSTDSIFGRQDLNNLLSQFIEIEHKYYKLWLSSTVVLQRVLHSKIYNQSAFELEEIKMQLQKYVQNNSYKDAVKILNQHRYVIISGIPGIGKTTLARVIIFALLSDDFEEFVYLSDNIDSAYTFYKDGTKQIFFFDDFLGSNFFETKGIPNNGNKIVKFIEKIRKSPDKFLILATREYILNQAKSAYESFGIHNIEMAKCTLDLSSYTHIIRAQILYNHLFFANVPFDYLQNLLYNKNYLDLVRHRNYNPRIIETIVNRKIWEHCPPEDFSKALKSLFDNPESVWVYAFENSIDKFSQYTLIVLLSLGTPILIEDLEDALKEFLAVNNFKFFIPFDSIIFKTALRNLEDTFIKTQKDSSNSFVVEYQNPSVQDFLVNYLLDKKDLVNSVLAAILFTDQVFRVFSKKEIGIDVSNKVLIDLSQIEILTHRITFVFDRLKSSEIIKLKEENGNHYQFRRQSSYYYTFLNRLYKEFGNYVIVENLVYQKLESRLYVTDISSSEQKSYITLMKLLSSKRLQLDKEKVLISLLTNSLWMRNIEIFASIKDVFPEEFTKTISSSFFLSKIDEILKSELKSVKDYELDNLKTEVQAVGEIYNLDLSAEISELTSKEIAYEEYLQQQEDSLMDDSSDDDYWENEFREDKIIGEIFNSFSE